MEELVKMGLDSIIFSMQGATKKGYEKMRNNNQYDKLHENILKLVEIRGENKVPYIHISSTITDETPEEIESFKEYWTKIVDSVDVGKTNLARLGGEEGDYLPCNEVYQKLSIDWDGKVTACCGDYDNLLTIGDIKEESLVDIFNGEKLKSIRGILDNKGHKNLALCSKCYKAYGDNF
jgi:radical SAM protein with 4Fe4S-binding SPASM domain